MKRSLWLVLALVILLFALGTAGAARVLRHRWETARRESDEKLARSAVRLRTAQAALAEPAAAAIAEQAAQSRLAAALAHQATLAPATELPDPDDGALLAAHPALLGRFEQAVRAQLAQKYAPLFRRFALKEGQIAQLLELRVRDAEDRLDLQGAVGSLGLAGRDSAPTAVRRAQLAALRGAEERILGSDTFAAWREFDRQEQLRTGVEELAGLSLFSPTPLTSAQAERLVAVLARATRSGEPDGPLLWEKIDWDQVTAAAAGILSESQLASLRSLGTLNRLAQRHFATLFPTAPAPP